MQESLKKTTRFVPTVNNKIYKKTEVVKSQGNNPRKTTQSLLLHVGLEEERRDLTRLLKHLAPALKSLFTGFLTTFQGYCSFLKIMEEITQWDRSSSR